VQLSPVEAVTFEDPVGVPVLVTLNAIVTAWDGVEGLGVFEVMLVALEARFTTCPPLKAPELPMWLLSPEYVAVMASVPTGKPEVVHVAVTVSPLPETAPALQPVFALQLTVPVMFAVEAATDAVNVTD
jgi:hypothetical protein